MRTRQPSVRATRIAIRAARSQMGSTISITRPTTPTFDSTSGLMTAHDTKVVAATIPARIYPTSGGGQSFLGSEDTTMRTTTISVMETDTPTVFIGDHIVVVGTNLDDAALSGREFRVMDVALGGILDPTRKLVVEAIEPNQFWTKA